ncbi:phthiocerol/phthiodiolone dimycocerosyl transferase family protein [Actinacidiphila oryziradicis]|uniref:Phthiocerol/phthiodiolone dimycocerosyl transferase n=1 Tax=Actinacidiphila oryziradicis TaxID=2571141 RepID=A0A4U0S6Z0_9ACTN|nr:acyltransferase [Actinacidiphila oryziradicis]TKA02921.1 acyltransferase [Actinacidiphila oryziradicis]
MTAPNIRRVLAPTEAIFVGDETYVGYSVRVAGRIDLEALQVAYAAVCQAYPVLPARLDLDNGAPAVVPSDVQPEIWCADGDPDLPLRHVTLDQCRALSALEVIQNRTSGTDGADATNGTDASVTLATQHSIADADHSLAVLAALWSAYTDAVAGVPIALPRNGYPRSLEDLLAERGIGIGTGTAAAPTHPVEAETARPSTDSVQPPPNSVRPSADSVPHVRHVAGFRLSRERTAALIALGHREQVTINSLLSGVVLLAEAEIRDLPLADLVYRFSVNLRSHLTPPVGPAEGTNIAGGLRFQLADSADGAAKPDAIALGRAVGARLRAGLADGSVQRALVDRVGRAPAAAATAAPVAAPVPRPVPRPAQRSAAVVSMVNWGTVPVLQHPEDLRLVDFRSASRMRVLPGRQKFAAIGGYVAHTFDGRLGVELSWPEADPEQTKRLDLIQERLTELADR